MKARILPLLTLACLGAALPVQAQDSLVCNQFGRELALRATEQGVASLDAGQRVALAQLAETVCLEYQTAPTAPASAAPAPQAPAAAAPAPQESGGLFDLEIIDPEDRVQRPGLKRR